MNILSDERPLMGQDPFIFRHNDQWLLIESQEDKRIVISTLSGLDRPRRIGQEVVWDSPNEHQVWAPEIHRIDGHWFIYYTSSDGGNASHRTYVLGAPSSPFGPYLFKERVGPDLWGIDMTTFKYQNQRYAVWSGWEWDGEEFPQNLYIARMDSPVDLGPRIKIAKPTEFWETSVRPILEGPQILPHPRELRLLYSANASWSQEYATAILNCTGDPLKPSSWVKQGTFLAVNCGHGMIFDGGFAYHMKLSQFEGWTDRAIVIIPASYL